LLPQEIISIHEQRVNSPFESLLNIQKQDDMIDIKIGVGQYIYSISLLMDIKGLVKLADFGTSIVGHGGIGNSITLQQFTTLENVPPEFLILGSSVRQDFSADTFQLGLSFLHMLTGYEPYEVLLANVLCSSYLIDKLKDIWIPNDIEDKYHVVQEVVDMSILGGSNNNDSDYRSPIEILCHTLYRYCVLFCQPEQDYKNEHHGLRDSPVWILLKEVLGLNNSTSQSQIGFRRKRVTTKSKEIQICRAQFKRDSSLWNIHNGKHQIMIDMRYLMNEMGEGTMRLLEKMVAFDPAQRCTMLEAITSPVFSSLIDQNIKEEEATWQKDMRHDTHTVEYMHYYRPESDGGIGSLPLC
jgi:serine/threonine protein kinase